MAAIMAKCHSKKLQNGGNRHCFIRRVDCSEIYKNLTRKSRKCICGESKQGTGNSEIYPAVESFRPGGIRFHRGAIFCCHFFKINTQQLGGNFYKLCQWMRFFTLRRLVLWLNKFNLKTNMVLWAIETGYRQLWNPPLRRGLWPGRNSLSSGST